MMTHTYNISGMTCSGCEAKVKGSLLKLPDVLAAEVSKDAGTATISMQNHITLNTLQEALGGRDSKYQIVAAPQDQNAAADLSFFSTYKPVLLLLVYIALVATIASWNGGNVDWMMFMRVFMGGFFLSFSFFKLINLKGFAESYAMYDVIAKVFPTWGYVYAFIELALGLAFVSNFDPFVTNWSTLTVMSISIVGVLQSVLQKRKIQCACLGAVFNLPMSTLTIVEDFLMIAMSAAMLLLM